MPHGSGRELMERVYTILRWPEDIRTKEGRARFEEALKRFRELIKHDWIRKAIKGKARVVVLDLCGGTGIGGIALAKVLVEEGVAVDLIVNDVRENALRKAIEFSKEILGFEAKIIIDDALNIHKHDIVADVVLLYGLTTPHFSPYDMVRLTASVSNVTRRNGVFIVEELDRTYNLMGYKDVLAEVATENAVILSFHAGYDIRTGMFKRILIDLSSLERVALNFRFWDMASTAAILWMFFKDVYFMPIDGRRTQGFLIARQPRGLKPDDYRTYPSIVRK